MIKDKTEAMTQKIDATLNSVGATRGIFIFVEPRVFLFANINPSNVKRKKMLATKIRNHVLLRVNGLRTVSIVLQMSSMSILLKILH
jgi:hypothetical protein